MTTTHIYWYSPADGSWGGCPVEDLLVVDCDALSLIERAMMDRAFDKDNQDLFRFAIARAHDRIKKGKAKTMTNAEWEAHLVMVALCRSLGWDIETDNGGNHVIYPGICDPYYSEGSDNV